MRFSILSCLNAILAMLVGPALAIGQATKPSPPTWAGYTISSSATSPTGAVTVVYAPIPPAPKSVATVAASDLLVLQSSVQSGGVYQPRSWTWAGVTKTGYNCCFLVSQGQVPGIHSLVEANADGSGPVSETVATTADPYTTVNVPANADLAGLIAKSPDLTRLSLAANATYRITTQAYLSKRLQIVGQAGTTIVVAPAIAPGAASWPGLFGVFLSSTSARLGLVNLSFVADTGGRLNSSGKTGVGAVYAGMGSVYAVNCRFDGMDFGIQLDSTPNHQADGVLVQNCTAGTLKAQSLWIAGQHIDVDGCDFGPSAEEHPIRSSIVNAATNQIPQFVRIAHTTLHAKHQTMPGKEALALRDIQYFYLDDIAADNWFGIGQGAANDWDSCRYGVFNNVRLSFETIHFRVGVTGPMTVTGCKTASKIVVGVPVGVVVSQSGNTP